MTLFLSGGYKNIFFFFTFLYSVGMETENPNLVAQISAQNPHFRIIKTLKFKSDGYFVAKMI